MILLNSSCEDRFLAKRSIWRFVTINQDPAFVQSTGASDIQKQSNIQRSAWTASPRCSLSKHTNEAKQKIMRIQTFKLKQFRIFEYSCPKLWAFLALYAPNSSKTEVQFLRHWSNLSRSISWMWQSHQQKNTLHAKDIRVSERKNGACRRVWQHRSHQVSTEVRSFSEGLFIFGFTHHCDCHLTAHFELCVCVCVCVCVVPSSPAWASAAGIPRSPEPPSKVLVNTKTPLRALAKPSSFQDNHFTENIPEHTDENTNNYEDPTKRTKRKRANMLPHVATALTTLADSKAQPSELREATERATCQMQNARHKVGGIFTVIIAPTILYVQRYDVSIFQFNRSKF